MLKGNNICNNIIIICAKDYLAYAHVRGSEVNVVRSHVSPEERKTASFFLYGLRDAGPR
jgi:hypothetical protein